MGVDYRMLGRRIRSMRKRRGYTQQDLSEMIDKSPTYLSYIESGAKSLSLDTLVAIVNALRISTDEVLKDCLDNTIVVSNHEFAALISDCSDDERRVMIEVAAAAKMAMREKRNLKR